MKSILGAIFSVGFVILASGFVAFTPDMAIYQYWMEQSSGRDVIFNLISSVIMGNSLGYPALHFFYISLGALSLSYLVGLFNLNQVSRVLVILAWLSLEYISFTSQLRYFPSYFLSVIAVYFFHIKKRKLIGSGLLIFAILNHLTVALVPVLYIIFLSLESSFKSNALKLFIGGFTGVLLYKFYGGGILQVLIDSYIYNPQNISSLAGGIYSNLAGILGFLITYLFAKWGKIRFAMQGGNQNLLFLYRISIMPILVLIPGIFFKVLSDRFIDTSILFVFIFMVLSKMYMTGSRAFISFSLCSLYVINIWSRYFLDYFVFGNMHRLNESLSMFLSSTLFKS